MTPTRRRTLLAGLAGLLTSTMAYREAIAQDNDAARPVTLVVPFATGGSADILARVLATVLGESLKKTVIVDNRSGAAGMVGMQVVAKAAPDGHTLLLSTDSLYAINPALYGKKAEDLVAAMTPVVHLAEAPLVIAVNSESAPNDFAGFLAWAKSSPKPLSYGTPGVGTDHHLLGELIAKTAGVKLTHVPYRGAGAAIGDIAGKQIDALITLQSTAQPLVSSHKIKLIAVASNEAPANLPNVSRTPQVLKGTDMVVSYSVMAPIGTPPAVVARYEQGFNEALRHPSVRSKLSELGLTPTGGNSAAFAQRMSAERRQREGIIRDANIKLSAE